MNLRDTGTGHGEGRSVDEEQSGVTFRGAYVYSHAANARFEECIEDFSDRLLAKVENCRFDDGVIFTDPKHVSTAYESLVVRNPLYTGTKNAGKVILGAFSALAVDLFVEVTRAGTVTLDEFYTLAAYITLFVVGLMMAVLTDQVRDSYRTIVGDWKRKRRRKEEAAQLA